MGSSASSLTGKSTSTVSTTPVVDQSELNRQAEEEQAQAIEASKEEARLAALQEQGREGTILTGSLGVTEDANVQTKTLLGQ
ncbi:MAG: hypothetical protein R3Y11_02345 [Pseudomonadota bacterium]